MGPFEMVVLIVAFAMIAKVIIARYNRTDSGDSTLTVTEVEDMRTEIRKLKDRVAVLERLATDDSAALAREIDSLR
ncbi:MAG: hypothetical protein E2598_10635 [Sphingobium sp.]|nr:hypothetical protein [Sphingobium sp.]